MLYLLKKANQQTNKTKVRDVFKKKHGGVQIQMNSRTEEKI